MKTILLLLLLSASGIPAQSVQNASQFPGADMGEKIARCIAALPAKGGICDARDFSGEQRAAAGFTVGAPGKPVQLMLGPVTLITGQTIYVQAKSSITGMPSAMGIGNDQAASVIKAADQSALHSVVELSAPFAVLEDLTVDGNRRNAPRGASAILVNKANRVEMFRVTAQNAPKYGIELYSSNQNESCCAKLTKIMAVGNGAAGLHLANTADVLVSSSEFENNDAWGIELNNAPSTRIEQCDIGGNMSDGIMIYGSAVAPLKSSRQIIVGNQFGNNRLHDINVAGSDGNRRVATGHLIANNEFIGSDKRPGGYDAIHIAGGGENNISGNIFSDTPEHPFRSCVFITGDKEAADLVTGNLCRIGNAAGSAFTGTASTVWGSNQPAK
ncbi:MAG TPA: right-handed parallel beta-helix repeat-containing protein [Candidatus Angelobacter sp.]|nr:right-handed parallel beta-helix repeat-containing protein [Candidatus Angelobacter sp.]